MGTRSVFHTSVEFSLDDALSQVVVLVIVVLHLQSLSKKLWPCTTSKQKILMRYGDIVDNCRHSRFTDLAFGQLDMLAGDVVYVLNKRTQDDWWEVELRGRCVFLEVPSHAVHEPLLQEGACTSNIHGRDFVEPSNTIIL